MKIKTIIAGLGLLASFNVQALDVGFGVKAGTVGAGVDLSVALTQTVNVRLGLTSTSYEFDDEFDLEDDEAGAETSATIDADLDLDFGATALLLDWYVFDGTFHVSAGFIKNNSSIDLTGTLVSPNVTFNGTTYNVADAFEDDSISGSISAGESFEPYIGLGWGRKADDDPGFSFSVEVGVMLMSPDSELTAPTLRDTFDFAGEGFVSLAEAQADLDDNVTEAQKELDDELSALELFPIISFGLNYAF